MFYFVRITCAKVPGPSCTVLRVLTHTPQLNHQGFIIADYQMSKKVSHFFAPAFSERQINYLSHPFAQSYSQGIMLIFFTLNKSTETSYSVSLL